MKKIDIMGVIIYSEMKPKDIFNRLKNRLPHVVTSEGLIVVNGKDGDTVMSFHPPTQNGKLVSVITYDDANKWMEETPSKKILYKAC